jgi:hypothetical protein
MLQGFERYLRTFFQAQKLDHTLYEQIKSQLYGKLFLYVIIMSSVSCKLHKAHSG